MLHSVFSHIPSGSGDAPGGPGADACPPGGAAISLAGTPVWLVPERAVVWPAEATVIVADVHIGKAATFRARGVPVPAGTTHANLTRLAQLVRRYQARRLVVLGDFLHAVEAQTPAVLAALAAWRKDCGPLDITLVRGNHDSHAGDPPASLGIAVVDEPYLAGPFAGCHYPQTHATQHVLAGHVHPAVRLRGQGGDGVRLPCFVVDPACTTLPAFGEFTGGHTASAGPGRRLFAVGGGRVWPLP